MHQDQRLPQERHSSLEGRTAADWVGTLLCFVTLSNNAGVQSVVVFFFHEQLFIAFSHFVYDLLDFSVLVAIVHCVSTPHADERFVGGQKRHEAFLRALDLS